MDPTSKEFAQRAAQGQAGIGQDHLDKATPIKCEYKYTDLERVFNLDVVMKYFNLELN